VKAGTFPAPVRIGARAVAWRVSEVEQWLEARPLASATA
jgi:prophage regulatory protein